MQILKKSNWINYISISLIILFTVACVPPQARRNDTTYSRAKSCSVHPSRRSDCGWGGIDRQACLNKNCCFDNTVPKNPDCYYPE